MTKQIRHLGKIISGQNTADGAGVKLKRTINAKHQNAFDPFLMLDEFASENATDYIGGFPDHPHRGFETVTYMLAGAMVHRDHMGNVGHLRAGDVQWMTAGHGIIHSEMPEQEDGLLRGFQLWLNLPAAEKMQPPHYRDYAAAEIPQVDLADGGYLKAIAGRYQDADGNSMTGAVTDTSTQPQYFDIALAAHQQLSLDVAAGHTVLVYVYDGELAADQSLRRLSAGQLGQLLEGEQVSLTTEAQPARLLLLSARAIGEPVVQSGPFVMNTIEEIEQAFRDYRDGVLTQL